MPRSLPILSRGAKSHLILSPLGEMHLASPQPPASSPFQREPRSSTRLPYIQKLLKPSLSIDKSLSSATSTCRRSEKETAASGPASDNRPLRGCSLKQQPSEAMNSTREPFLSQGCACHSLPSSLELITSEPSPSCLMGGSCWPQWQRPSFQARPASRSGGLETENTVHDPQTSAQVHLRVLMPVSCFSNCELGPQGSTVTTLRTRPSSPPPFIVHMTQKATRS